MNTLHWHHLIQQYALTSIQQQQFEQYLKLLLEENEKYNLTAIVEQNRVIADHFLDSLSLIKYYDMQHVQTIIDVGSGAGFPGIPLAILNPSITFCLIEVNLKKVDFLYMVCQKLNITNVIVTSVDWRTFLRTKVKEALPSIDGNKTLVIARASLAVNELLRMFKPSSLLSDATLVYWASQGWKASQEQRVFLHQCIGYQVEEKIRQLCFFKRKCL